MKFTQNQGIEIDETIKRMLETAIKRETSQNRFAIAVGVPAQNVQNWRGTGRQVGEYILWDQWEKLKPYFVRNGDIDGDDPRWMTPAEMRDRLSRQLSPEERQLLVDYRKSNESGKAAILATAAAQAALVKEQPSQSAG